MVTVVRAVLEGHRQYPRITLKGSVTWLMRPFHKISLVSLEVSLSGCLRVGVNTEQQVCRGRERGAGTSEGFTCRGVPQHLGSAPLGSICIQNLDKDRRIKKPAKATDLGRMTNMLPCPEILLHQGCFKHAFCIAFLNGTFASYYLVVSLCLNIFVI